MMKRTIAAVVFMIAACQHVGAQTYNQMHWGINTATTPYTMSLMLNNIWYPVGTITSGGAVYWKNSYFNYNAIAKDLSIASTYDPFDGLANNTYNMAIGPDSLASSPNSNQNIAIGWLALNKLTGLSTPSAPAGQNVAIGAQVLNWASSGQFLVGIGTATGRSSTSGFGSISIGHGAQGGDDTLVNELINTSPHADIGNVNIGGWSGQEQTGTDTSNPGVSHAAVGNTCLGTNSCLENGWGSFNVAIGYSAMQGNVLGVDQYNLANQVNYNVCLGNQACLFTSGGFNSSYTNGTMQFYDNQFGYLNPTNGQTITIGAIVTTFVTGAPGAHQVQIGADVPATLRNLLAYLQTSADVPINQFNWTLDGSGGDHSQSTILYASAKALGNTYDTTVFTTNVPHVHIYGGYYMDYGTGVGVRTGNGQFNPAVPTAKPAIGIGYAALANNYAGAENTAIGYVALNLSQNDTGNTAVGNASLYQLNGGNSNTAVGDYSVAKNRTGSGNTGIGYKALFSGLTGAENTGVGNLALYANTGGGQTAVGSQALYSNTDGYGNSAIGYQAMLTNTRGVYSTAVGSLALTLFNPAAGNGGSTAVGAEALSADTTGINNTTIGFQAGKGIVAGNNNVVIGSGTGGAVGDFTNNILIGVNVQSTANNQTRIGDGGITSVIIGGSNIQFPNMDTGLVPAASVCVTAGGIMFTKTTAGSCI
jgi:trimeric autotransporter adhesin